MTSCHGYYTDNQRYTIYYDLEKAQIVPGYIKIEHFLTKLVYLSPGGSPKPVKHRGNLTSYTGNVLINTTIGA